MSGPRRLSAGGTAPGAPSVEEQHAEEEEEEEATPRIEELDLSSSAGEEDFDSASHGDPVDLDTDRGWLVLDA